MSPGPTFERVYQSLKEQLRSGRYPPGTHLEPRALTDELCSSITPIRDALHRLVGERIVEAPRNDGFRAPILTELALRELYGWQADLVRMAVARGRTKRSVSPEPTGQMFRIAATSAADLFLAVGAASGDTELATALTNCWERLGPVTMLEKRFITDLGEELEELRMLSSSMPQSVRPAIASYVRRRNRAVPQLVAALQQPS
jgi:hypothetical protein